MFERFSHDAREVVKGAEAEARELGSPAIEAEHLLLALADRVAALPAAGLDHDGVLAALDAERDRSLAAVGVSASGFEPSPLPSKPKFATSAKSALELARLRLRDFHDLACVVAEPLEHQRLLVSMPSAFSRLACFLWTACRVTPSASATSDHVHPSCNARATSASST